MIPSKAVVPVYYHDQDATWMKPFREVSRIESRRLKIIGAGQFFDSGRKFRLHQSSPPPPISLPPGPLGVAETITFSEIQANVGITAGEIGTPADRRIVRQAQSKIRSYPHIFDRLAVGARGSWHQAPIQISVG